MALMSLKFYNTLTRELEVFTSISDVVKIYTCGPTVYDYPHIGNWRSFIFSDTLRRSLNYLGYQTKSVINITDVDDKTILGSQKAGQKLLDFTRQYEEAFLRELDELNILTPDITPRATEYVPQMIELITHLLENGCAQKEADGIYFLLAKDENYGRLKNIERNIENDFALWKFWKESDGEVVWEAPFGKGRPGWHTECLAMILALLGEEINIHTGGIDLIFPHHENELAQALALTDKPLANFWLHSHFVNINNEKMSKSLNNFITLNDLKNKKINPLAYRYFVLNAHYQTDLNYTDESIKSAQNAYEKLQQFVTEVSPQGTRGETSVSESLASPSWQNLFREALEDNLNTAKALGVVWRMLSDKELTDSQKLATILDFDKVLGLDLENSSKITEIPPEIAKLLTERELARKAQNWPLSDTLRTQIESLGYQIKDTDSGSLLTKK